MEFQFSDLQRSILSNSLDFLTHCETFSFESAKISYDSAISAADKLDENDYTLTRGEVRAAAKAVELCLSAVNGDLSSYAYIDLAFPGILAILKENAGVLQSLNQWLSAVVKDLQKMK